MIRLILTALALIALVSNAEARQRHKEISCIETGTVMAPKCGMSAAPTIADRREARGRYIADHLGIGGPRHVTTISPFTTAVGRPSRYIAGHLICAVNVGAALAERGIKGTGSALALSYLHWGRSAGGPVPGAVIVSARRGGGHVAIVSRVENGIVYAWNATGGQRGWREVQYRHRVLDYRVPG